jgi:hypothetical protein
MKITMCSTSRIVPVRRAAGMASARRSGAGSMARALAVPARVALLRRKSRRVCMGNPQNDAARAWRAALGE